jgi:ABC-type dipeptide/oligopeptide/nickel transport system permease subunit
MDAGAAARGRRRRWARAAAYWPGWLGALVVGAMTLCAVLSPQLAPHDPYVQDIAARLRPPMWAERGSAEHPLGTDHVGRDYLSRIIYGARVSLAAGVLAVLCSGGIGVAAGVVMGFWGGAADRALTFLTNLTLTFPFMLLAIAVIALIGSGFLNMILVLGLTGWPIYARVVRAEVLSLREREFVAAGVGLGSSPARILLVHVLPNLTNLIVVMASVEVARMIIVESFLSYLGLGVPPPTPSWGGMLSEAQLYVFTMWWLGLFPGLAIFVTVLGINLIGDTLRDWLDPHMKTVGTG